MRIKRWTFGFKGVFIFLLCGFVVSVSAQDYDYSPDPDLLEASVIERARLSEVFAAGPGSAVLAQDASDSKPGFYGDSLTSFSPDLRIGLQGAGDGWNGLWNTETGSCLRVFQANEYGGGVVLFSASGNYYATGGYDRTVLVWDTPTGDLLHELVGHEDYIMSLAVSPDDRYIASGSGENEGDIILWDADSGVLERRWAGHEYGVFSISFSSDGERLLSGGADNLATLWDVGTGEVIRTFEGHDFLVTSVGFTPDDKYVVIGTNDGKLMLYETETGAFLEVFWGGLDHGDDWVHGIAVSPDGRYAVTASQGGNLRLWDLLERAFVADLVENNYSWISRYPVFSLDGSIVMTAGPGAFESWSIPDGEQLEVVVQDTKK